LSDTGVTFSVQEFVEGTGLNQLARASAGADAALAGQAVGRVLAAIGTMSFSASGFFDDNLAPTGTPRADATILRYVQDRMIAGPDASALQPDIRSRFLAVLEAGLLTLPDLGAQTTLVDGDFNPKNILIRRDSGGWHVAAILDWEFAFSGTPLWDIANMLRHRDDYNPEFCSSLMEGFLANGGDLPHYWERAGRIIDSVNLAEFLARGPSHRFYQFAHRRITSIAEASHF